MEENRYSLMLSMRDFPVAKADTMKLRQEIDRRVRKVFELCESDSATVRSAASKAIDEYTEAQRALFKSKGLPPDRAFGEAMIASESPDGSVMYRIVPRKERIDRVDMDEKGIHVLSVQAAKPYSARVGLGKDEKRGKYNDGGLLIAQAAMSVDASETVPFVSM